MLFCGRPLSSYGSVIDDTVGDDVLVGTPGDDLVRGLGGSDTMFGNAGNDCIEAGGGNDIVWAGAGDDTAYGMEGDDKLVGDAGDDRLFGEAGADSVWGNAGSDMVAGGPENDALHGDSGSDRVYGNEGDDLVWGGPDGDIAVGGSGNDSVNGDAGDDQLWGGEGEDTLLGSDGDDRLYGQEGRDTLYGDAGDDGLNGGKGIDACYDVIAGATTNNVFFGCEEPGAKDERGDSPLADFDIKGFGLDGDGHTYIQVYGAAGRTLPSGEKTVYAYVVQTDAGIYASDSHEAQHADDEEVANRSWHGHKVVVGPDGCIDEIGSFKSQARLAGDRVTITETGATQILGVLTVRLDLQVDEPDNPPPGVTCLAKVMEVYDEAGGAP